MKKRIVTDTQYPTPPYVFRYMTEEAGKVRRKARKAWLDSGKYTAADFPRLRTYVILIKVLTTGKLYAYSDNTTTNGYPFSVSNCMLFKCNPKNIRRIPFTLKAYREDYSGAERVKHWFDRNMPTNLYDKTKYDMFIARVGSKNCPISVKFNPTIKNQVRASFTLR